MPDRASLHLLLRLTLASSHASQLVRGELDARGVDMYLFGLLTHVAALAPVSPGALAEDMAISATTIRDQVQWLVDQELIERRPNPADARSYLIVPTRKGKELLRRGSPALDRVAELLDAHLDRPLGEIEEAVDAFERALRGLLASSAGSSGARAPRRNRTAAR